jgi:hypothetical protein
MMSDRRNTYETLTTLKLTVAVIAMTSAGSFGLAPAANAAKVKECGTTTTQLGRATRDDPDRD